jgi:hypothetical protein
MCEKGEFYSKVRSYLAKQFVLAGVLVAYCSSSLLFHPLCCNLIALCFMWTASTMPLEDPTTALQEQSVSDPDDPMADLETYQDYKKCITDQIAQKMMYVSGETGEPSPETTGMVEEIVRQQVIEMVCSID